MMKEKLLIFLLVISCIPLFIVSAVSSYLFDNTVKADYIESSHYQVDKLQFEIQSIITKHLDLLKLLAKIPSIQSFDVVKAKPQLVEASRMYPMLLPINIVLSTGREIVKSDDSVLASNISDRNFFQAATKGQTDIISETLVSRANSHLVIVLATPIRSEDKATINGVLTGTIDLDVLIKFVTERSKDGVISYIVDREGKIIAHPQNEFVVKHSDLSNLDYIQEALKGGSGTTEIKDEQGILRIVDYTYEPTTGWVIVQESPYSILSKKSRTMLITNVMIIILTMLIIVFFCCIMANKMSRTVQIGTWLAEVIRIGKEQCMIFSWTDIAKLEKAQEDLQESHDKLEIKVRNRTRELSDALNELRTAQQSLIQSEKMASLGSLVAGVAHEINTPVGVGVTAASYLKQITIGFTKLYESNNLKRKDLVDYITECNEVAAIISTNLERAAQLIKSFKQVSVDQSSEAKRIFNVKEYLDEILLSLQPKLKITRVCVKLHCDDNLNVNSYPGALAQIVTNLVINSVIHAYDPNSEGTIVIDIKNNDKQEICLSYSDDGKGMEKAVRDHIFDPFFTTKRGIGSGLGLFVLYNIVTKQFGGVISCESELGKGTTFKIHWPLRS